MHDRRPAARRRSARASGSPSRPSGRATIVGGLGAGAAIVLPRARERHIDFAALQRAQPDLIVASQDADERDLSQAARGRTRTVYIAPGDSIRQVERAITQLGLLTGDARRGATARPATSRQRRHVVAAPARARAAT